MFLLIPLYCFEVLLCLVANSRKTILTTSHLILYYNKLSVLPNSATLQELHSWYYQTPVRLQ